MDEDYKIDDEEEEDVVGLLFAVRTSDEDFVPPVGVGQGQGESPSPDLGLHERGLGLC